MFSSNLYKNVFDPALIKQIAENLRTIDNK